MRKEQRHATGHIGRSVACLKGGSLCHTGLKFCKFSDMPFVDELELSLDVVATVGTQNPGSAYIHIRNTHEYSKNTLTQVREIGPPSCFWIQPELGFIRSRSHKGPMACPLSQT